MICTGFAKELRITALDMDMDPLVVSTTVPTGPGIVPVTVKVVKDECQAIVVDDKWFARVLGKDGLRLVRITEDFVRPTNHEYASDGQTAFADAFPFLLATEESLGEVNRLVNEHLSVSITHQRFRPNIVVRGAQPFAEDRWAKLRFHDTAPRSGWWLWWPWWWLDVRVARPCERCSVPDVDPDTGIQNPQHQPTKTMRSFRSGEKVGLTLEKWKHRVSDAPQTRLLLHLSCLCINYWSQPLSFLTIRVPCCVGVFCSCSTASTWITADTAARWSEWEHGCRS
jgi:uncharacterized protein YcbX